MTTQTGTETRKRTETQTRTRARKRREPILDDLIAEAGSLDEETEQRIASEFVNNWDLVLRTAQHWYAEDDQELKNIVSMKFRRLRERVRNGIKNGKSGDTEKDRERRERGRSKDELRFRSSVLDWPIVGGKALRDVTRVHLAESIAKRKVMAEASLQVARFEQAVFDLLPTDEITVGKAVSSKLITVKQLEEIKHSIFGTK